MIDKQSGKTAYASCRRFGGFLGIGERYHPLPWSMLIYDVQKGCLRGGHRQEPARAGTQL
jgi:hypothetical protein